MHSEIVDADVIEALAPEVNTEAEVPTDSDRSQVEGRSYTGAQLWRIPYTGQDYKNAVSELQKTYQTNMWNLQMANASNAYVDMFLKQSVVDDAREFLTKAQVPFEVIIDDVQDSIENQNPPLDDIDLWQNRDGKYFEKLLYTVEVQLNTDAENAQFFIFLSTLLKIFDSLLPVAIFLEFP